MSVGAKHWALAQKVEGGSSPRVVLFYLADWVIGANQTECWPPLDTLVFETGMNRQTIMKATASLEKQGLITKRTEWLRSDKSLKKRVVYCLNGYVPSQWVNSKRPNAPDSTKSCTSEKLYVQDLEPTGNRTFDGTKSHTFEGTKNRTFDGTKFRTVTGIDKKEQGEEQVVITRTSSTSAENNNTIPDDTPAWVTDGLSSDSHSEVASTSGGSSVSDCGSAVSSREDTFELTPNEPPAPKQKKSCSNLAPRPDDVSEEVWAEYQTLRKAKRSPVTNLVIKKVRREAEAAGITIEDAMTWCVERGFGGFYASWYQRDQNQNTGSSGYRYQKDRSHFAHEKPDHLKDFSPDEQQQKDMAEFFAKKKQAA